MGKSQSSLKAKGEVGLSIAPFFQNFHGNGEKKDYVYAIKTCDKDSQLFLHNVLWDCSLAFNIYYSMRK